MCDTCGCSEGNSVTIKKPGEDSHEHHHHDEHHHHHPHEHNHEAKGKTIAVEQDVLQKNNLLAEQNRKYFKKKSIFTLNLVSSPGSGKTTLLEKTLADNKDDIAFSVIEGDQQTMRDADRINATGVPVIQVNTGTGCHLDSEMILNACERLDIPEKSILLIENVGNLVCPALFDLGEAHKVVVISVTEGDDKPHKYPTMFASADICIINKIDLLPYVDFDIQQCRQFARQVNHHLEFFELSAKTGEGLQEWYDWLKRNKEK
ncbi:MAG: hydrogenase nickel incorporation protein HypB [Nitrospinae bacterium]|nr:hydrogenase nickel incorporation protein HypB [Nitrospinota bacterium]